MKQINEQFSALIDTINDHDKDKALDFMKRTTKSCSELLLWIDYLNSQFPDSPAKELLIGSRASMLEAVAYIGMGLGRAAIGAIRTQIDLILSFTFFCEHPREWEQVKTTGEGFKLRTDIYNYHKDTKKNFNSKLAIVEQHEDYTLIELYKILSAHLHGQSPLTIPKSGHFLNLLSSDSFLESLIELQACVDRSLSNYLTVVFIGMDLSPPLEPQARIKKMLKTEQVKKVFFDD